MVAVVLGWEEGKLEENSRNIGKAPYVELDFSGIESISVVLVQPFLSPFPWCVLLYSTKEICIYEWRKGEEVCFLMIA